MSDVNAFEDFDFSELFDLDFREKNLIFESEKKRIQKLVEASDIEMTEFLFYGEKKTEIVSINKKKEPCKKVERKTEALPNKNKSTKSDRKKKDFKDIFGESEFIDPYELEYGNIFSKR
jgi:DNA replication protein DnaD